MFSMGITVCGFQNKPGSYLKEKCYICIKINMNMQNDDLELILRMIHHRYSNNIEYIYITDRANDPRLPI